MVGILGGKPVENNASPRKRTARAAASAQLADWRASDGTRIVASIWEPAVASARRCNVLCLPGLSRNARDFEAIAQVLQGNGHRVIAIDYRGRGLSDWSQDHKKYIIPIEGQDIHLGLDILGIDTFAVLGTSRGGLHAMTMAQRYGPARITGIVLNDIGAELAPEGMRRIANSVGYQMFYKDRRNLAMTVEQALFTQFPSLDMEGWMRLADQLGSPCPEGFGLDYDPALSYLLQGWKDEDSLPDLWPLFEAIYSIPLLVLRGEKTDLLTPETLQKMLELHPDADSFEIPGQGHAPLLWDEPSQQVIAGFLEKVSASS